MLDWFSRDNAIMSRKFQSKMFPYEPEEQKKDKRGTFIGKDEGASQTSP